MSDDGTVPHDGMNHFGHELKAARERQSLPLAQVATLIRVREAYLDAIERHDWDALPEPVFTRGYIQSYAQFLHLDPNLFLNAYGRELRIARASQPPAEHGEEDETKALLERLARTQGQDNSGFWWRSRWMALILVGACAGGAAFWFSPRLPSAHAEEPAAVAEAQDDALVPPSETFDDHETMPPSEPPSPEISASSSGSMTSPPSTSSSATPSAQARSSAASTSASPHAASVRHSLWAWSEHSSNEDSTAHPVWSWSERSSSTVEEDPPPSTAPSSGSASMLPSTALAALDVPPAVPVRSKPEAPAPPTIASPAPDTTQDASDGRLAIDDFGVGTGVSGRQLVGRTDHFGEGTTVWFWTRVLEGRKGDSIRHVWLRDGRVMGTVHLSVGGPQWRTQSRWRLGSGTAGSWTVEARDADDRVLATATFRCGPS